jgi:hypothetical protein
MSSLELGIQELVKGIDSEETLNKLKKYLIKLKKNAPPCQLTEAGVIEDVLQSEQEFADGLGISHDKVRRRYICSK